MRSYELIKYTASIGLALLGVTCAGQNASASENLNLETALELTQACISAQAANDWPPMAVAIYDNAGRLISFQAPDGTITGAIDLALGKAKTSASFPASTLDLAKLVESNPGAKGLAYAPGIVIVQGGLPIMREGKHVGGIGVSGGQPKQDEDCAKAALKAL